ncbi:tetratricopeptide repeat protein [Accumulibacter sp.]|uniref:Tetratricopeptide repeat protein n=1 Tax=Candidatus Accumulibacter proximus TaxID=2954385 RepID=A0A935Q2G0_9PROT|nr:tetratricopeptide repeat protein [Accumulibacter sp.]MBK7676879.1 tetratricopeptide repeat protein [Candidatus Accumulibacter proximus]MBL8375946.1 tetratricopeptide repeat protein [Accumulibacter sp.]
MSLLMDALRRAEEAKRLANPSNEPAPVASPDDLTLAPLEPPSRPHVRSLPPLSRHLDSVDADLASAAGTAPPGRSTARPGTTPTNHGTRETAERTAARNVFAVKQPPRSRTSLWLFLGLGGLATLAIGSYFWWQLQSLSNASLVVATPPMRPTNPSPAPALAANVAATRVPPTPAPQPLPTSSPEPPPSPRAAAPVSSPARGQAASTLPRQEAALFRASNSRAKQDQTLNQAYEAWQANRLDDARRGYDQVLRSDPWNTDALLGLAAIATRQGQAERAQELYLRVLEADPGDVTAQAALISLRGHSETGQSESRLKTLLAGQPDASALHFALGNLYARQGRWTEAQQAYFQAYALEPDNGDYLFNVAVSLDHLRQSKLAAQYYRMALSAAETRRSAFNTDAAGKRILELQP